MFWAFYTRRVARLIFNDDFSKADFLQLTREPYYCRATPLHTQLFNFRRQRWRWSSMNMAIFRESLLWKTYRRNCWRIYERLCCEHARDFASG